MRVASLTTTPTDHWYIYSNAVISGNTVTLTLTDNADGDAAYSINQFITDPGGPGAPAASIPTLSEWGLLLLAGLLGVVGVHRLWFGAGLAG